MPGIIVDIGTGDGSFAYALAKEHPDRFIIGIDPHHKALEDVSSKINKKPAKGGVKNALFVLSDVEHLPEELTGIANQVFINFPWSGLLRGIILVEQTTWKNIKRICQPGAYIDVLFGYESDYDRSKIGELNLPELSAEYIDTTMKKNLETVDLELMEMSKITTEQLQTYPSTWAKKLSYGHADRTFYHLRVCVQ